MTHRTCKIICICCLIFIGLLVPVLIGQLDGQTIACKTESVTLDHKVYWWHTHSIIVWPDGTKTAKLLSIYPQEEQNKALQACPKFFKELKKRGKKRLDKDLYYFCRLGKHPNMGKLLGCCFGKNCPHLATKPRKKLYRIRSTT